MRHLYQRYVSDCYPTCIGMVADISYAEAVRLVHPFRLKGSDYSTDDDCGIQVLRSLGFKVRKRYLKSFAKLKHKAIIVIDVDPDNDIYDGHAVVWDPISKSVFDPDPEMKRISNLSFYKKYIDYVLILT